MARVIDGVEFNGNPDRKVKKGQKNNVHIKGSGLGGTTPTITKMKSVMVSGSTVNWTVDGSTIVVDGAGKHINFKSYLPTLASASQGKKPTGGDFGDITITLEYFGEPELLAPCEDVEHEP